MVLIAASMVLLSVAAQAGETRSLSLSTGDSIPAATSRSADGQRAADANPPAAPAAVAAPAVQAAAVAVSAPARAEPITNAVAAPVPRQLDSPHTLRRRHANRAPKPQGKRWSQSRIISELHRHGIYW
jgi:hypothetical protein